MLGAGQPRSEEVKFQKDANNVITVFAKEDRRLKRDNFINRKKRSPPHSSHKAAELGVVAPELKVNLQKKARSPPARLAYKRPTRVISNNTRFK